MCYTHARTHAHTHTHTHTSYSKMRKLDGYNFSLQGYKKNGSLPLLTYAVFNYVSKIMGRPNKPLHTPD